MSSDPTGNSFLAFDRTLFHSINTDWSNAAFDWFFPFLTDLFQNPFVMAISAGLIAFWIYRQRTLALKWIALLGVAIAVSDLIAFRVIKPLIHRERPPQAGVDVIIRTFKHTGDSFPSNHATNSFAAATVLSAAFPNFTVPFFTLAALIAFSRVYVGAHFPVDVIAGALLGNILARLLILSTRRFFPKKTPKSTPPTSPRDNL